MQCQIKWQQIKKNSKTYTTIQKFGVTKVFFFYLKKIYNISIQQGCIKGEVSNFRETADIWNQPKLTLLIASASEYTNT